MNKPLFALFLLYSLFITVSAQSMDNTRKSCDAHLLEQCLGGNLERALTAKNLNTRTFKPYTLKNFAEAKINFAKKGILVTKLLIALQDNPHLREVAQRAKLNGLCIVENETEDIAGVVHDAFTGISITQFKDGAIHHAIAVPQLPDRVNANKSKRQAILSGIIEREIARISKSYTHEDDELTECRHMLSASVSYGIGSCLLGLYFPPSLLLTVPLGLLGSSVQKEISRLSLEIATDKRAVELAHGSDNLIATLETTNQLMHESNIKSAKTIENGTCNLAQCVQRIHILLEAQQNLKETQ